MKPVQKACLALVLLAVPAPAYALEPISVLVAAIASAAAGVAGGAALSSAGIGVAGQAATAPAGTGSIQPSGVRPPSASPMRKAHQSGKAKHVTVVRRSP